MPWIRDIHLVVSNIEQVPEYAKNYNVKVVLHKDIMPERFLPIFNSCAIELFLHRVPGISEHFLYFNDDFFVLNPIEKDYFFTRDGHPINGFHYRNLDKIQNLSHGHSFLNAYNVAYASDWKHERYKPQFGKHLELWHDIKAMTVSNCEVCWNILHGKFIDSITPFRSEKSINGYVFQLYDYFTGKCEARNEDFAKTFRLDKENIDDYGKQFCCINNTE